MNQPRDQIHDSTGLSVPFRDRHTGLVVSGVLLILIGVLCLGFCALMLFGKASLAKATPSAQSSGAEMAFVVYLGCAALMTSLGIGSILCRRWARSLVIVVAWIGLSFGIMSIPMMVWLMPKILASTPAGAPKLPPGFLLAIVAIQIVIMSVLFVAGPAALILFYGSHHVRLTCETRDPHRRWTDACPLPLLGLATGAALSGATLFLMPMSRFAVYPFFGIYLMGLPGVVGSVLTGILLLLAAWQVYRMSIRGWWLLVGVILFFGISSTISMARTDFLELYRRLGMQEAELRLVAQSGIASGQVMLWLSIGWLVPAIAYLLWTKRYFRAEPLQLSANVSP